MSTFAAARRPRVALVFLAAVALALATIAIGPVGAAKAVATYTLSGTVSLGTAGNTAPAGDVTVWWGLQNSSTPIDNTPVAVDSQGRYSISGLTAGKYIVFFGYAGSAGYGSQWWGGADAETDSSTITIGANLANQNITLPPSQTVNGHVTLGTASGGAAQSATVSWSYSSTSPTGLSDYHSTTSSVQTDASGNFSVTLPGGWYYFSYHSPDSGHQNVYGIQEIVNASPVTINQVLPVMDTISGHVTLGAGGPAAAAGQVSVAYTCVQQGSPDPNPNPCSPNASRSAKVYTDANGNYSIGGLYEDAQYALYATDETDNLYQPTTSGAVITDSTVPVTQNITMIHSGSISGTVSLGSIGSGAPSGRVKVNLSCDPINNQVMASTTTDATGRYSFTGLASSSYCTLQFIDQSNVYAGGYWSSLSGTSGLPVPTLDTYNGSPTVNEFTVGSTEVQGMNVTMPLGGFISGAVTTSNGSPLAPPNGADQVNVDLVAGLAAFTATTNSDGTYSLGPVLPGTYTINFSNPIPSQTRLGPTWAGSTVADPGHVTTYTLAGGQHLSANAVQFLRASLTLSPTCTNCGSTPIYNAANIIVQRHDITSNTWVDVDPDGTQTPFGIYRWPSISPGDYRAVAVSFADGSALATGPTFTVAEGTAPSEPFSITLPKPYIPSFLGGGVGDFDSDGNSDVIARDAAGNLDLYRGNGVSSLSAKTQLDGAANGWGTATAVIPVGDFTGDGHPDIMMRDQTGNLWLYPGTGGSGFGARTEIGTAANWSGMTAIQGVGDLNFDRKPDVVARDSAGTLWLYPNNGSGTGFGTRIQLGSAGSWSAYTSIVGAGDWNNDGDVDIIARDASGVLWLYPGTHNTAYLGARTELASGWQGLTILSAGDFNNDDSEDLLARDSSGTLWLYPGNGTAGFSARISLGAGWQGQMLAGSGDTLPRLPIPTYLSGGVGDFNSDGDPDIVMRDGNGALWLYPGSGSNAVKPRTSLGSMSTWGSMTALVPVGDFTGDGNPDVMGRDKAGNLMLFAGNGASGLAAGVQVGANTTWAGMTSIQGVGDLTGDHKPDVVARDTAGNLWLYPNNGSGTGFGTATKIGDASVWGSMTGILGSGDWNLDGTADLVGRDASGNLLLFAGDGAGHIAATGTLLGTGWQGLTIISVGDFNGDGTEDILIRDTLGSLYLYPGNGSGGFSPRTLLGTGWQGLTLAGSSDSIAAVSIPKPPIPTAVSGGVGDFNSDGNPDIVMRDGNGALWLYPGNGSNAVLPRTALGSASTWGTMSAIVPVGDFSGDGHPDLMGRDAHGTLYLFTGNGGSGLGTAIQVGSTSQFANMTAIQGVGDFNGDGKPDVIMRDNTGTLWFYPNNGSNGLGTPVQVGTTGAWASFTGFLGAGDWNLDGKADLVARDSSGVLWLYPGNGDGTVGPRVQLGTGWQGITVISVGDFNEDGTEDILIRDANGVLFLYPGNGSGFSPRIQLGTGWQGLTMAGNMDTIAAVTPAP